MTTLGMTGLHPWDSRLTHDLQRTIPATYVLVDLNYNWWFKGVPDAGAEGGDGPAFYDALFALHAGYKIILSISAIPNEEVDTFLPMILDRYASYNIWGVRPVNEQNNLGVVAATVAAYRMALPRMRLIGPDYSNSYAPGYLDPLVASGTLAQIDVLSAHDYWSCPGNGTQTPQPWGEYCHPHEQPYGNYPTLPERIAWLKSYVPQLRQVWMDEPRVILTEYGLYANDVADATSAGIISRTTGVPFVLSSPQSPAGQENSFPYGNGVYAPDAINPTSVAWSAPMQEFLRVMK